MVSSMIVWNFPVAKTAPLASDWGELMFSIKVDVADRVTKTKLIDPHAASDVAMHLYNWH